MKKLNVGLIGYGFMGRTHSNAFTQVNNFFDLEHRPVLKAICARDADKLKTAERRATELKNGSSLNTSSTRV